MAVDPSVRIDLAAEFTGKKAFDKADKSTAKLTKGVKSLAKGFLGVFAAQKLLSYGKASVKAFAADDAAAKSLGITLKNLGLAYGSNVGTVNGFINRLEAQTGVLDDELRPAMDRFLRATNDVAKSQELLNLSLDVAAGTGKTVTQVSQSLQKAFLGQTAAIGRLGVGISKAELASGSFEEIQQKLNTLFAGQATSAANTYQGSLNKLTVASNNAKETIGKGLVDALGVLSGSATIDPTVSAIDRIANSIANTTVEAAKSIRVLKVLFSDLSFFRNDATLAEALRIKQGTGFTTPMTISSQDTQKADALAAAKAKALATAKINSDKLTAAAKIKADKLAAANKLKLDKAASIFDLAKIQIAAALKGKITDEERTRLLLMQAIEEGNADKAEALAKKLQEILEKNIEIAEALAVIGLAKDPFSTWAGSLSLALLELAKYGKSMADISATTFIPGINFNPSQNADRNYDAKVAAVQAATPTAIADAVVNVAEEIVQAAAELIVAEVPSVSTNVSASPMGSTGTFGFSLPSYLQNSMPQAPTIIINNNGSVIMQDEFIDAVNDAVLASQRFGYGQTPAGALL